MGKQIELKLKEGDLAPSFTATTNGGGKVSLSDFKGKNVILYFYPRDNTPGCTKEACAFRDEFAAFKKKGAVVLGVSTDSAKSHDKFAEKYQLPFTLRVGRGQEDRPGLRGLGGEELHGPEIPGHASRDLPDRAGRPDQEDLARREACRARQGGPGGAVNQLFCATAI